MSGFDEFYERNWKRFDYDEALEVWQAAERQALERALATLERFGKVSSADLIRALIENDAQSKEGS
jgi:hypothetical protein